MSNKPESNKSRSTDEEKRREEPASSETTGIRINNANFTEHKPPPFLLSDGGSFILESHRHFPNTPVAHAHPKRPFRYQDERKVDQIKVTDLANNTLYLNGHAEEFRIKVWLVKPLDTEPEVVFGGNPLVVEVDQDLGRPATIGNPSRRKRFMHPNAAVSIKKIVIENNGGQVFFRAEEHTDNGFQILIWVDPEPAP